jgi:cytochrome c553
MKNIFFVAFLVSCNITIHAAGPYGSNLGGLTLPCATCHGLPGEKNNAMNLYGIKEEVFFDKFKSFQLRSDKDRGVMHYISRAYSDDDIRRMATYFAEKQ